MSSYLASTNILTKIPIKSHFGPAKSKPKQAVEDSSDSEDAASDNEEQKTNISLNYNKKTNSQALNHLIHEEEGKAENTIKQQKVSDIGKLDDLKI